MRMNTTLMTRFLAILILSVSAVGLAGCISFSEGLALNYAYGIFKDPDVNLKQKTNAAMDYLISRSGDFITRNHTITVEPVAYEGVGELRTDFGDLVALQLGERLIELGYKTDMSHLPEIVGGEEPMISDGEAKLGHIVLSGHYVRQKFNPLALDFDRPGIHLYLKFKNEQTGRTIAMFDHAMAIDRELAKMMEPAPKITRVSE